MRKVQANEFQRNIGTYQDMALTEPLTITRWGRAATVILSLQQYERLKRFESVAQASAKPDGVISQSAGVR
jgi:PHD/YefM family antitoxin component YafN of YafNO toxin-antitoxin module